MKQIIIGKNKAYATAAQVGKTGVFDLTLLPEGVIAVLDNAEQKLITAKAVNNFSIACGRGAGKIPILFSEVDVSSLSVQFAEESAGNKFKATITIPATEKGKEYTIVVTKKGCVFNERNNWTVSHLAKDDTAYKTAKALVDQINANSFSLGLKASVPANGSVITFEAENMGDQYVIQGADELMGLSATISKADGKELDGAKPILDKAYVQDLASRCAAGKGFNYLGEDGKEIYPGYPEVVEDVSYNMFTLRFAVPRVSAKQRDEVVYQTLHIVLPKDSAAIATLKTIFGVPVEAQAGQGGQGGAG